MFDADCIIAQTLLVHTAYHILRYHQIQMAFLDFLWEGLSNEGYR